jgi:hypothetical protein
MNSITTDLFVLVKYLGGMTIKEEDFVSPSQSFSFVDLVAGTRRGLAGAPVLI